MSLPSNYRKLNEKVAAEVFACLIPGELQIRFAHDSGYRDVPVDLVPFELRLPNTLLWLQLDDNFNIIRVWARGRNE